MNRSRLTYAARIIGTRIGRPRLLCYGVPPTRFDRGGCRRAWRVRVESATQRSRRGDDT